MDGVVASPLEIARIRRECGKNFFLIVPGVRSLGESWDDQKRVLTPEEAMRAGADYLVVGKPIRDAKDPREAARQIVQEMEQGRISPSVAPCVFFAAKYRQLTNGSFLDRCEEAR